MIETFSKDLTKILIIVTLIMISLWLLDPPNHMVGTWEYAGTTGLDEDLPSTYFDIIVFHQDGTFTRNIPSATWYGTFELVSYQVYLYYEENFVEVYEYDEDLDLICRSSDQSTYRKIEDQSSIFND